MAILHIPDEKRLLHDYEKIRDFLGEIGIDYERWNPLPADLPPDAPVEDILVAYSKQINVLKSRGGYQTADVIDVNTDTPGLDYMLSKFNIEHCHDEDEVRYILEGRGLFHIHPHKGPIVAVEVQAGDLIRVPRGVLHWFNLCGDRRIRAIRLFQDVSGWTPHYSRSSIDQKYEPVCWGPSYIPPRTAAR